MSEIFLSFVFGVLGGVLGAGLITGFVFYKVADKLSNHPMGGMIMNDNMIESKKQDFYNYVKSKFKVWK